MGTYKLKKKSSNIRFLSPMNKITILLFVAYLFVIVHATVAPGELRNELKNSTRDLQGNYGGYSPIANSEAAYTKSQQQYGGPGHVVAHTEYSYGETQGQTIRLLMAN